MLRPTRLHRPALLAVLLALAPVMTAAAEPATANEGAYDAVLLDQVLVVGEQPGPGLWQVRRNGHVLWIMGTHSPLPKDLRWRSDEVARVLASSQALLRRPSADLDVGVFRGLALLPSLLGVRNNPGGRKLQEVVPMALYARWRPLQLQYLGRDRSAENWRPLFAARELWEKAVERTGLADRGMVAPVIDKLARRHKLKVIDPKLEVPLEQPRSAIREFKAGSLDDTECFARTIERLETDLALMRTRANAWARGDVAAFRKLSYVNQGSACLTAILNSAVVQQRGLQDVPQRVRALWLAEAEQALATYPSTFALLPMSELLAGDGPLAQLRSRGYEIVEP